MTATTEKPTCPAPEAGTITTLERLAREFWLGAVHRSENPPRVVGDDLRAVVCSETNAGITVYLAAAGLPSRPIRKFASVGEATEFVRGAGMFRDGHISPAEIETAIERLGPLTDFERGVSDG